MPWKALYSRDAVAVEVLLDLIASEMTWDEILEDHPELEREDIVACLNYARLLVSGNTFKQAA